ncbi:TPA: hypothetical protein ACTZ5W_005570 [Bacillus cereus]
MKKIISKFVILLSCILILPFLSSTAVFAQEARSTQVTTAADLDKFIDNLENGIPMSLEIDKEIQLWNGKVIIFTDRQGHRFVLKQINSKSSWDQSALVRDYVGARISEEMNLPINRVRIIPAQLEFSLKPFPGQPATLHTFAEGEVPIAEIQQKAGGEVPIAEKGLTYSAIKNMAKGSELPLIAALDTFLGNADRKNGNLLYRNNHYIGIDFGDMLIHNLAETAINQFQTMRKQHIVFSPAEKMGLQNYYKTLNNLFLNYPAEKIIAYLHEGTNLSGLKALGIDFYNVTDEIYFSNIARKSVNDIPKLLQMINQILIDNR